jgi:hypothetical protein
MPLRLTLSRESVAATDMSAAHPYVSFVPGYQYFDAGPGAEHYRLLARLAAQCPPGSGLADVGTYLGLSAAALATGNPSCRVASYDVVDLLPADRTTCRDMGNVAFRLANLLEDAAELERVARECVLIVLDVDPHDGVQEVAFVRRLIGLGYAGVVVCDDVHLNDAMRVFWNWVPLKKIDATCMGHSSGTGIIVFDEDTVDVVLE